MGSRHDETPRRVKAAVVALIVVIGLLTFHVPHFLVESNSRTGARYVLQLALSVIVLAAVVAAAGIYRDQRWGWVLGMTVAAIAVGLYVAQETVGLPGLPRTWWEPSRIVSLVLDVVFLVLAWRHLEHRRRRTS